MGSIYEEGDEYKQVEDLYAGNETQSKDSEQGEDGALEEEEEEDDSNEDGAQYEDLEEIRRHPSYEQVLLDVNRCAGRLEHIRQCYLHRTDDDNEPPEDLTEEIELDKATNESCGGLSPSEPSENSVDIKNDEKDKLRRIGEDLQYQRKLKRRLAKLIVRLLIKKPDLHYYQGFHDVCLTYMTIYGETYAFYRLDRIVDSHFSTFMQPTMNETQELLALIPIIIGLGDSKVQDFLEKAEVGVIFALSWVITWFSHVIPNERDVETIFSYLEENDPHLILYLCSVIVLYKRDGLLSLEPEMSTVHHFLCQVPRKEQLPINLLLRRAFESMEKWPPESIKQKLDEHRRDKLQLHNQNLISTIAHRLVPSLVCMVTANSRTAIIVFVVASALALQYDRWIR